MVINLVETKHTAGGVQTVECATISRTNQMDLVEMAKQIQTVITKL